VDAWAHEASVQSGNIGFSADFTADDTVDAAMAASMAALQSALAIEESILAKTAPAAQTAPAAASALLNANALLGPGAGGLLPVASAIAGASAWDEMERRMAALADAIDSNSVLPVDTQQDVARAEARAARMREREAKRQAKRLGLPMPVSGGGSVTPPPAYSRTGAVSPSPLLGGNFGAQQSAAASSATAREVAARTEEEAQRKAESQRLEEKEKQRRTLAAADAAAKADAAREKAEKERLAKVAREADKQLRRQAQAEREQQEPGSGPNLKKAVLQNNAQAFREQCRACCARAAIGTSRLPCMLADGAPEAVLQGMAQHSDSPDALIDACTALQALALGEDRRRMKPFCEDAVEALRCALDAHPDAPGLALACYGALSNLVVHAGNKSDVGALVLAALTAQPENEELAVVCCAALRNAALGEESNRVAAAAAGVLEALMETLKLHAQHATVVEQACWALKNMCVLPASQMRVAELGGIEEVMGALRTHARAPATCEQAVWALRILAFAPANAMSIVEGGGVSLVVDTQKAHIGHEGVQETCCGALRTLAALPGNRQAVVDAGAAVRAVAAMRRHAGSPAVQMAGCGLLSALVGDQESQRKTASSGAVEVLLEAVRAHPRASKLQQACFCVLTALAAANSDIKARAAAAGAVEAALNALAEHVKLGPEAPPGMAEATMDVLATVVNTPQAQRTAIEQDGLKRVLAAMRLHRNVPEVAEKSCRALSAIVWCLPQAHKAARKAGLLDDLLGAMNSFASHKGVQKAARALMATIQVEADDESEARQANSRSEEPGIASLSLKNPNARYTSL